MLLTKDLVKSGLHKSGLFPIVRTAYRRFNGSVRKQHRREVDFYASVLRRGGLCFDVGANLGQRSEVFAELENRVIVIEPNAVCQKTLRFLFGNNNRVKLVSSAVGAKSGFIDFYTHGTDATGSAIPDWDEKVFGIDRGNIVQTVPMTTLDDLLAAHGVPDFVKIDVEGFETEVLNGLTQALPLLSFEFHSDDMQKTRTCLSRLASFGAISVRACSMDCEWLTHKTSDPEDALRIIEATNAKGDLFVWSR
jgi:FkbM family methyltransferase